MSRFLTFFLAAAAAATSHAAAAQCRLCKDPTTDQPAATLTSDVQVQVETDLNFDRLILAGAGTGVAVIRPDGSSGAEGAVTDVGPRATVGTVLVHGEPGRALRIDIPGRIELYTMGGGRLTLEDVATDAAAAPRLDSAGNLSFRFGGRLILSGNSDGRYHGDLPVTVDYADDLAAQADSLTAH